MVPVKETVFPPRFVGYTVIMKKIRPTLIAALSLLTLAGCTAHADTQPATTPAPQACVNPGTWFDPQVRQTLTTPQALARLKDARVVLLGETHVIADHHRWHLQTVAQLYAQRPDMILGFEAFPRRVQPVLDQWVAGELSEDEFLKQSEWETVWRYDPQLYLPLFHFARINHIPMVALNVDRALIGKVSQVGWKAVPETDRLGISDPAPASAAYVKMLSDVYGQHSNGAPKAPGLDDPRFANFVDVQVTWDRAMAEASATALQGNNAQLVAVVGRGHMDYGFGIPHQLADLGVTDVKVLVPWDKLRPCEELTQATPPADLVYGLATTKDYLPREKDGPKLGVLIESADGGVLIKEVMKDSLAHSTGLKAGDLIVRAAGQRVAKSGDLITIIKAMTPGTWLPLNIQRKGIDLEIIARFPVPQS